FTARPARKPSGVERRSCEGDEVSERIRQLRRGLVASGAQSAFVAVLFSCLVHGAAVATTDTAPSPGSVALTEQASKLEAEIAKLLQQRTSAGAMQAPLLEMRIDLRLVERWLLARAADSPEDDATRDIAALRADQIRASGETLDA